MRATTTSAPFARTCIGNGSTSARARVTYAAVRALAGCCGTRVHVSPLPRIREQPAPCPLRRLPLLRSDCLSAQVGLHVHCGGSQLHAHCGRCLCCGATAGRARAAASSMPTAAAASVAERLQVERGQPAQCHCGGCRCCGATAGQAASCEAHPVAHVNTRQGLPLDRAWSLMPRDYGCCGTEKPAKRGEVESPLRLGQRPNECDALANRASCEAHPVAHVNTRQGLSALRRYLLYIYIALAASPSLLTSGRCGNPPGGGHRNIY